MSHRQRPFIKRLFFDCNVYACPIPSNLPQYRCLILAGHLECGFSPKVAQTFTLKHAVPANCSFFPYTRPVHPLRSVAQLPEMSIKNRWRLIAEEGKGAIMRKQHRNLEAIKYAFVCSMVATFSVMAVAGLFFGLHISQWSEWQGRLVGVSGSIAGVAGAFFGVLTALDHPSRRNHSSKF